MVVCQLAGQQVRAGGGHRIHQFMGRRTGKFDRKLIVTCVLTRYAEFELCPNSWVPVTRANSTNPCQLDLMHNMSTTVVFSCLSSNPPLYYCINSFRDTSDLNVDLWTHVSKSNAEAGPILRWAKLGRTVSLLFAAYANVFNF